MYIFYRKITPPLRRLTLSSEWSCICRTMAALHGVILLGLYKLSILFVLLKISMRVTRANTCYYGLLNSDGQLWPIYWLHWFRTCVMICFLIQSNMWSNTCMLHLITCWIYLFWWQLNFLWWKIAKFRIGLFCNVKIFPNGSMPHSKQFQMSHSTTRHAMINYSVSFITRYQ